MRNISRAIRILFFTAAAILGIYTIISIIGGGSGNQLVRDDSVSLDTGWTRAETNEVLTLPCRLPVSETDPVTITRTLPGEGKTDWILMIRSNHQFVDVNIDNNSVFSCHSPESQNALGHSGGYLPSQWFEVYPGSDWFGKELAITYTPDIGKRDNYIGEVFLGDKLSVVYHIVKRDSFFLLSVFSLIGIGILLSVLNFILHRNGQRGTGFTYVASMLFCFGIWFFCKLECVPVMVSNLTLVENLGILCLFMLPFPIFLSMNQISEYRYEKVSLVFCCIDCVAIIFVFIEFLTKGGRRLVELMSFANLLCLLPLLFTIYVAIQSFFNADEQNKRVRWYVGLLLFLFICALFENVSYLTGSRTIPFRSGLFTATGTLILSVGVLVWAAAKYRTILERINTVEAESKARTEFYSGISHQIRNPINGMIGMNEMILRESTDPQITGYATDIKKSGIILMEMVNEMLKFSGEGPDSEPEVIETVENLQKPSIAGHFTAPKASVLVVDDTDVNRRLAEHMLKRTKIRVTSVSSGKECLEKVKTDLFDVILMDHMMPEMDGIETLHALQDMGNENLSHSARVIALTANAIEGTREYYLGQGFDDYLSKPVDGRLLEEMLLKYIPDSYIIPDNENTNEEESGEIRESGEEMSRFDNIISSLSGIIDTETGLRYCMNDPEFYVRTLERFADADKQDLLEKEYRERDNDNYRIHVHALKSSARLLGAQPLSDQAAALEEAMAKGDNEFVTSHHSPMMSEYTRVRLSVENAFRENPAEEEENLVPIDEDELKHLLIEVRDGLDEFDMDAADSAARRLSSANLPEKYRDDLKKLVSLVADVDLDNALTLVNDLLERM